MKIHFDIDEKYRWGRNHYPERYPHTVYLPDFVPSHWWCAAVLAIVRQTAERLTDGDYGLFVTRDERTHQKTGYLFGSNDPAVVKRIRLTYLQARLRAERVMP